MKPQEQKRKVIQELHLAGNSPKDIISATKYPLKTVYRVVKKLKAGEGIGHRLVSVLGTQYWAWMRPIQEKKADANLLGRPQKVHCGEPGHLHGGVGLQALREQEDGEEGRQGRLAYEVLCQGKAAPSYSENEGRQTRESKDSSSRVQGQSGSGPPLF